MDKITWSEKFSVGDTSLDSQHVYIIDLINRLIDCENHPANPDLISDTLSEINDYSRYHLEYEENLLEKLEYPEYNEHKIFHLEYLEKTTDFSSKGSPFDNKLTLEMLDFLTDWWLNHILVEDIKYKPFLEQKL